MNTRSILSAFSSPLAETRARFLSRRFWALDDHTLRDVSGLGHDGVIVGNVIIQHDNARGPVLEFFGTHNSYVRVPADTAFDLNVYTVMFWVNPYHIGPKQAIFAHGESSRGRWSHFDKRARACLCTENQECNTGRWGGDDADPRAARRELRGAQELHLQQVLLALKLQSRLRGRIGRRRAHAEAESRAHHKAAVQGVQYKVVRTAQLRAGFAMHSKKSGILKKGRIVPALEQRPTVDGVMRVRFPHGWVSIQTKSGLAILVPQVG